ncbi:hypothetical protein [Fodinibius halophilus]|uniref:Uncharacterized protein n=1 Tax=Fodinibius halophilus TaxID=1736908 RepID=A0A6M1THI3_9BACT|nr:hypothetical protein [Fodinibius halophilus]NGP90194.1 hypothetical protein [Fodinibius halophilus]
MSIIITKDDSAEKIREAIQQATTKKTQKSINLDKYFGKIDFDEEGLEYQKRVRNEWK